MSPVGVISEDIISCLRDRVARKLALGIVPLRRLGAHCSCRKRVGCGVILECRVPPSAAVSEPLAVLHHEVDVMLSGWHDVSREERLFLGVPMHLRHLRAVGKRLTVAWYARPVGLDYRGIAQNRGS